MKIILAFKESSTKPKDIHQTHGYHHKHNHSTRRVTMISINFFWLAVARAFLMHPLTPGQNKADQYWNDVSHHRCRKDLMDQNTNLQIRSVSDRSPGDTQSKSMSLKVKQEWRSNQNLITPAHWAKNPELGCFTLRLWRVQKKTLAKPSR